MNELVKAILVYFVFLSLILQFPLYQRRYYNKHPKIIFISNFIFALFLSWTNFDSYVFIDNLGKTIALSFGFVALIGLLLYTLQNKKHNDKFNFISKLILSFSIYGSLIHMAL